MKVSTISKRGNKSSPVVKKPANRAKTIERMMEEVDGDIDRAIHLAAREAALRHIRDGRVVPVWENEKVVWKPAAQALAESDAAAAAEKKSKR